MKIFGYSFSFQHFRKNFALLISAAAADFLLLFLPYKISILTAVLLGFLIFCLTFLRDLSLPRVKSGANWRSIILLSILISVYGVYVFYQSWLPSSKLARVAEVLGLSSGVFLLLIGIIGAIVGFYAILRLSYGIVIWVIPSLSLDGRRESPVPETENRGEGISLREILFIIATAIITITICSKSSPLYPFNDWVDSNCFLTVGKSMLHGLVPYRDLFEQKGLILYSLHTLAALLSETSFIGVYLLEILACAFFLLFSLKLIRLYRKDCTILLIAVEAVIVYTAASFCHGDSAEEFCLPLIVYGLYVGLKAFRYQEDISAREGFLIGATSACVLWIKYTMLGFYLGWIVVPAFLLISKKRIGKLLQLCVTILAGVLVVTLPVLVYMMMNNALYDMWTVYFYDNIFCYAQTEGVSNGVLYAILSRMSIFLNGFMNFWLFNALVLLLILLSIYALSRDMDKYKKDFAFYLFVFLGLFLGVYVGGTAYKYYSLIFGSLVPLGLLAVFSLVENKIRLPRPRVKIGKQRLIYGCCICLMLLLNQNAYLMFADSAEMPQFKFAEIIAQKEDATLLNYGFLDGGFYTVSGIVPNCRYFCKVNMGKKEMLEEQERYLEEGLVDFIVTRDTELDYENYMCVAEASYYFEGSDCTYYLYQLVE